MKATTIALLLASLALGCRSVRQPVSLDERPSTVTTVQFAAGQATSVTIREGAVQVNASREKGDASARGRVWVIHRPRGGGPSFTMSAEAEPVTQTANGSMLAEFEITPAEDILVEDCTLQEGETYLVRVEWSETGGATVTFVNGSDPGDSCTVDDLAGQSRQSEAPGLDVQTGQDPVRILVYDEDTMFALDVTEA